MQFSVIVAFKNRDQKRVQIFLDSLKVQSVRDFEVVFVNQGSNSEINYWLEPILFMVLSNDPIYPFIESI